MKKFTTSFIIPFIGVLSAFFVVYIILSNDINWSFFDQGFLKDLISALIGTGTALFIFYRTLRADKEKSKKEDRKLNKQRINYLSNLATETTKQSKSFIKNLEKNISSFESNNLDFHLLIKNPNSSLSRLNEILNNENFFLAYHKKYGKKNIEKYNKISLKVDFFFAQEQQVFEMAQNGQTFDFQRKTSFQTSTNHLMNSIAGLMELKLFDQNDKNEVNRIFDEFYKNQLDKSDLSYFYEDFIRPILENVLINNLDKKEIVELISEFKNASNLFNEIISQNINYKDNLKIILENYKTALGNFIIDADELIKPKEDSTKDT